MRGLVRLLVTLVAPCTVLFRQRRVGAGVVCLLLQLTLVLWPFALLWAMLAEGAGATLRAAAAGHQQLADASQARLSQPRLSQAARAMASLSWRERVGHIAKLAILGFLSMLIIQLALPWVTHHAPLDVGAIVARAGWVALGISALIGLLSAKA